MAELKRTPLYKFHLEQGAKMVPFAGYEMPVQYAAGVMNEHRHTREKAGLFDVSHMGQLTLSGDDIFERLERLMPVDVVNLPQGRQRYGLLTNVQGGIIDDVMFSKTQSAVSMVVNASRLAEDLAHLRDRLGEDAVTHHDDRALLALQGPRAEAALQRCGADVAQMRFMDVWPLTISGIPCHASRSGYTGEDGFEISCAGGDAAQLAMALCADENVMPIGLGARDSLRLEAGLCLYGNDIDDTTTPIEANLHWAIQKSRRSGGFLGDARILSQLADGPYRKRVGLRPSGRAPMRQGVILYAHEEGGQAIGAITSGGFGPSVEGPVAMGYVTQEFSAEGTQIFGDLRGKRLSLEVCATPFFPHRFKR